ncbi:MAG: class I SAM-dependent methyltransferase [Candidatus Bathyarchaeota archaeon]|nr:class I SAM-dependent methyltransferase [Candidatus Bathyarchaeota archaeon]
MWERYYSTLRRLPRRLRQLAPFVVEALPTFKRCNVKNVLDLGCGAGRHCVYLAKNNFDVVGVDISMTALKMANEWRKKEKLKNITLIRATMTNLPFSDSCFDAVISVSVIHHAIKKDIVKTINEIYRALKRNGVFLTNLVSVKDPRYGTGQKVENNTFRILEAFEEKRFEELHHFFTKREISKLLAPFAKAKVELLKDRPNYWKIMATK